MINFTSFFQDIICSPLLNRWLETLPALLASFQRQKYPGIVKKWSNSVQKLPLIIPEKLNLKEGISASSQLINPDQRNKIENLLKHLTPWRKGPFYLYGINIDSEWRSDFKWNRLFKHISSLNNRMVLDVGCGNGYYLWRTLGAGAKLAVGIDPSKLFYFQFEAIKKLIGNKKFVHLLPIEIDQLPPLAVFDTVFSMGILYHRRSPLDHLHNLKNQLTAGGELILETLVLPNDIPQVLFPVDRYANMRNVWFIPSPKTIKIWLHRCGFKNIRVVDLQITTVNEQRRTKWANIYSLSDFLDPQDNSKTVEGYPAPLRAIILAKK
ncbi:MAG: tRNA 5-methoxyuridine(34)/uridine 5-oxyacetic acid(34) synthase CmoB [Candidatus Dasytiphilus stammeri]